ncbi:hypothetical protein AB0K27_20915 [Micromonospora echinospora]|uniref:hypothetical protein n=1 Tax=Micromonospora echinospora TaxID=1877 RepID=UPI0034278029
MQRLNSTSLWAEFAKGCGREEEALLAYTKAAELIPLVAWPGLRRDRRETLLQPWQGLAADGAAHAISVAQMDVAALLLEVGRAVLWAQSLDFRSDLTALWQADPALAERMEIVRNEIDRRTGHLSRERETR